MAALKTARLAAGMTQTDLATKAGITQGYVVVLENGYRPSRSRVLEAVAAVLHVPAADLLNEESGP
jgi:transcriptional regulator with XRE-family HTH domain